MSLYDDTDAPDEVHAHQCNRCHQKFECAEPDCDAGYITLCDSCSKEEKKRAA